MRKKESTQGKNWIRRIGITLLWLAVWQVAALFIDNVLLFAGPAETVAAWCREVVKPAFWQTLGISLLRILTGFLLALGLGCLLGAAAFRWRFLGELLAPVMLLAKAVPVASFAVMLLIWWGAGWLSVAICFLVALPMVYVSFYEGLKSTDKKLLEMARAFDMSFWNKAFYIYRPALVPFMEGCLKTALGMGIKAGVAAEVIGIPEWSIGGELYLSKIYLDTAGVFAWTAVIIALGSGLEKGMLFLWRAFCRWKPLWGTAALPAAGNRAGLEIEQISKSYGAHTVLSGLSYKLEAGKVYCLMAPSGTGKTTLLHILAGLVMPDEGKIKVCEEKALSHRPFRSAVVFQEDRLCEEETALVNVLLVSEAPDKAKDCLRALLPKEALTKPVRELSGGMRRRVCIARALAAGADCLLLDEPFAGLDEENRKKAAEVIGQYREGRLLVVATHEEADAEKLCGEIWTLKPAAGDGVCRSSIAEQ